MCGIHSRIRQSIIALYVFSLVPIDLTDIG